MSNVKEINLKKLKIELIIHSASKNSGNLFPLPEGFLDKYCYYFGNIAADLYNKGILVFSDKENQFVLNLEIINYYSENSLKGFEEFVEEALEK